MLLVLLLIGGNLHANETLEDVQRAKRWNRVASSLVYRIHRGLMAIQVGQSPELDDIKEIGELFTMINVKAKRSSAAEIDGLVSSIFIEAFGALPLLAPSHVEPRRRFLEAITDHVHSNQLETNLFEVERSWRRGHEGRLWKWAQVTGIYAMVSAVAALITHYVDGSVLPAYVGAMVTAGGISYYLIDRLPFTRRFRDVKNVIEKPVNACVDALIIGERDKFPQRPPPRPRPWRRPTVNPRRRERTVGY